ncbi:DinB family protein [Aquimarina longa]|uniref:DinB family protein n=1 Tax=Aquimarina longa TaxID=1080221 RepID=UPI0007862E61|nr:DinB family protein [Aquimarina longa]
MIRLVTLFFLISGSVISQQTTPKAAFLEKWNNSKEYLLEMAAQMPEDKYKFKPTERQMSFKDQLLHIHKNMHWLGTTYFSKEPIDKDKSAENLPETKKEIIKLLKTTFDKVYTQVQNTNKDEFSSEVDFFAGRKTKLQILNLLQDHVTHHRGQLIVYLNLNVIEPPRYVGW